MNVRAGLVKTAYAALAHDLRFAAVPQRVVSGVFEAKANSLDKSLQFFEAQVMACVSNVAVRPDEIAGAAF